MNMKVIRAFFILTTELMEYKELVKGDVTLTFFQRENSLARADVVLAIVDRIGRNMLDRNGAWCEMTYLCSQNMHTNRAYDFFCKYREAIEGCYTIAE